MGSNDPNRRIMGIRQFVPFIDSRTVEMRPLASVFEQDQKINMMVASLGERGLYTPPASIFRPVNTREDYEVALAEIAREHDYIRHVYETNKE
jgi:hypothetical protein